MRILAAALALALAPDAAAQVSDASGLRLDARVTAHDQAEAPRPGIDWKLTAGVAAIDAESGERRWATPFQLRARFNEGRTAIKISGDGYSRLRSEDGTLSGFNDVTVAVNQALTRSLIAEAGVTVPAGGEVGSEEGRERFGLIYNRALTSRWEAQARGRLTHYEANPAPGVSHFRRQGLLQLAYNLDTPRSDVLLQVIRSYRPGSWQATAAGMAYERPLREGSRPPMAALGFTRGLTTGAHDNTYEVAFSLRF